MSSPVKSDVGNLNIGIFYHRPVGDQFHGGSTHAREFIRSLSESARITIVAPKLDPPRDGVFELAPVLASTQYLAQMLRRQLGFILGETRRERKERCRCLIVFDTYAGLVPALWAKLSGSVLVYYAQDSAARVAAGFRGKRVAAWLIVQWLRRRVEAYLLAASDLVAVVSDALRADFLELGVPSAQLVVCEMPRHERAPDLVAVRDWRTRLGIENKVSAVFVGNLGYPPNKAAAEFLLRVVVPELEQCTADWSLILAGPGTERLRVSGRRVVALGAVVDLDGLLFASNIGVAPMAVVGGTSGKVVDYLVHGLSVLATPEAASGIAQVPELSVAPLDGFATALGRLFAEHPRIPPGFERTITKEVVAHYLSGSGTTELLRRLAASVID